MFNILIETDRRLQFRYRHVNSRESILSEDDVRYWTQICVHDYRRLCYTADNHFNNFSLLPKVKGWLDEYCHDDWRYWYDYYQHRRIMAFLFKDPKLALLFKLTWV